MSWKRVIAQLYFTILYAITTAILDRIIHKSEIIHLDGDSHRMKHCSDLVLQQSFLKKVQVITTILNIQSNDIFIIEVY
jgi:hypothetical protein